MNSGNLYYSQRLCDRLSPSLKHAGYGFPLKYICRVSWMDVRSNTRLIAARPSGRLMVSVVCWCQEVATASTYSSNAEPHQLFVFGTGTYPRTYPYPHLGADYDALSEL